MPDPDRPTFRVVGPSPKPVDRRGPGLAVIAIAVYALLFLAALWLFKYRAADARNRAPRPPAPDRQSLLSGDGLAEPARARYLARLESERCDCGCDMTLSACLARDRTCVRSPELAGARMQASIR
jgi:hypothetical protein